MSEVTCSGVPDSSTIATRSYVSLGKLTEFEFRPEKRLEELENLLLNLVKTYDTNSLRHLSRYSCEK